MKRSFLSDLIILLILFSSTIFGQNAPSSQHLHGGNPTPSAKPDDTMQDMPGMQHARRTAANDVHR